ncbi:MAG: hypothetical protein R6V28_11885 [Nitriliruptoraceae bacterium]
MRTSWRRGLVLTAAIGLFLAGCGDGEPQEDGAGDEQTSTDTAEEEEPSGEATGEQELDEEALEDLLAEQEELPDPNDDVEDGVYRGNGVLLPVPEGWSIDPGALLQGVVAAFPEDGSQQLTARAVDTEQAEASGAEPIELDTLLDDLRQQIEQDADTDEEIEVVGADRAYRLTYLDLPGQQEGQPDTGVTLVLAESSGRLLGEFVYSAGSPDYDDQIASLLVEEAGFDPDSEVPAPVQAPTPAPAPEGDGAESGTDDEG